MPRHEHYRRRRPPGTGVLLAILAGLAFWGMLWAILWVVGVL